MNFLFTPHKAAGDIRPQDSASLMPLLTSCIFSVLVYLFQHAFRTKHGLQTVSFIKDRSGTWV